MAADAWRASVERVCCLQFESSDLQTLTEGCPSLDSVDDAELSAVVNRLVCAAHLAVQSTAAFASSGAGIDAAEASWSMDAVSEQAADAAFVLLFAAGCLNETRRAFRPCLSEATVTQQLGPLIAFLLQKNKDVSPPMQALLAGDRASLELLQNTHRAQVVDGLWTKRFDSADAKMAHRLATVLFDEPLLILWPEQKKGWRVRVSGVTDNAQLQALLAAEVLPPWSPSAPLDEHMAVFRGDPGAPCELASDKDIGARFSPPWNLLQFTAVAGAGAFEASNDLDHWVWNEGVPADILRLNRERTLVLGPPLFPSELTRSSGVVGRMHRTTNVCRLFRPLAASCRVEETLDETAVIETLGRLAAVSPEARAKAMALNRTRSGRDRLRE